MRGDILNKNNIIQFILLILVALSSGLAWSGLKGFLFGNGGWVMPMIAFCAISIFLSASWMLLKSKIVLLVALLAILITFFLSFGFKWTYFAASLIALLFFYFGSMWAMNERDLRLKIKVGDILRQGLPALFTGLILLVSTAYYFSPRAQISFQIPRPLFDSVLKVISLSSNNKSQDLNLGGLGSIFKMPVEGLDLTDLPVEDLNKITSVNSDKKQEDELYALVSKIVSGYTETYRQYFTVGAAIGIFLTLKSMGAIFMWLVVFISWLIFKILIILGIVKIQEKTALQEIFEI